MFTLAAPEENEEGEGMGGGHGVHTKYTEIKSLTWSPW